MKQSHKIALKWSEVVQSCPTLFDPMDCSLPGSSVHGIFQARVLEWVAISFSTNSFRDGLIHEFKEWNSEIVSSFLGSLFPNWWQMKPQEAMGVKFLQ